jgi:hypothetical protein
MHHSGEVYCSLDFLVEFAILVRRRFASSKSQLPMTHQVKVYLIRNPFLSFLALASSFLLPSSTWADERLKQPAAPAVEDGWRVESGFLTDFRREPPGCATPLTKAEECRKIPLLLIPSAKFFLDSPRIQADAGTAAILPRSFAPEHPFWDRRNGLLFAAVGASRTLDYFSTLNMRRRGDQEVFLNNDTVDNHAAFAAIEAAGTAISIGASYLFHHYHHHRLERWTSIVHASLATSGAVRNYCLSTAHPSPTH